MNPQVFSDRKIDVGDTVFYNNEKFIVIDVNRKTLKSLHSNDLCTLNKKQFKTIQIEPFLVHQYPGDTMKQKLRHIFGYFPDIDRTDRILDFEYEKMLSETMNKNYDSFCETQTEAALASVANEKHNLLLAAKTGTYETCEETFFEYAYRNKVFAYCDTCVEYWLSTFKNEAIIKHLSLISQPPMNAIIMDPVLCIFRGDKKYDRSRIFEKSYVEKTLEMNKQNSTVEEPAYAEQMTSDQFWDTNIGDEVITQIDAYDVHFLNTKLMSKKHFVRFLNDGHHIAQNQRFDEVLPISKYNRGCRGIHFVSTPIKDHTHAPLKLLNFARYHRFIFDYVLSNLDLYEGNPSDIKDTFEYADDAYATENQLIFHFRFDEKNEDVTTIWRGCWLLEAEAKNDTPVEMCFTLKRASKIIYTETFHILLFLTDNEYQPLRLVSDALNADYEHETERHVKRGVVVEKFVQGSEADGLFMKIKMANAEEVITTVRSESIPAPNPINNKHRELFHNVLQKNQTKIQFQEKSYALINIYLGVFSIPSTVYYPNQYRLSNGKIPKSCKSLHLLSFKKKHDNGTKESFASYFYSLIKGVKEIIPKVTATMCTMLKRAPTVTMDILKDLIANDKLLEFHDLLNELPFAEKNKFIMKMRTISSKYPTNKLIMCAMNRNTCLQMVTKESMLDSWTAFFEDNAKMPTHIGTFKIKVGLLRVTSYTKKKMIDKLGTDDIYITPLILAILLKKVSLLPENVFKHCQNIQVTDYEYFPIHFIVHFCDGAAFRLAYVKMLFQREMPNETFLKPGISEFKSLMKKWNPTNTETHALLYALSEWPFDELYQIMFLTSFAITQKYHERDWFSKHEEATELFAHVPGNYVVEHKMKSYGYPQSLASEESFADSWYRGFCWLTEISLMFKDESNDLVVTTLNMLKNAKRSTEGYTEQTVLQFKQLRQAKHSYNREQYHLLQLYKTNLLANDDPRIFDKIFCSDFNIHFKFGVREQSMYELLLMSPELWQTGHLSSATVAKVSQFYLKQCPNFSDEYFKDIECEYYYMRLSLFSQYIDISINKKNTSCTESTVLCAAGGNLKQLKFIAGLQIKQNISCRFSSLHIQQMFSDKLKIGILAPYIRFKHEVPNWREHLSFGADMVEYLANGDGFVSDRVKHIVDFIELYMGDGGVWDNRIWHRNFVSYYYSNYDTLNNRQLRFIKLLENINRYLISVAEKLTSIEDGRSIMMQILNSPRWKDTYIKGVVALKKTIFKTPHLMSYLGMHFTHFDCSQFKWKESLKKFNMLQYETYSILRRCESYDVTTFQNAILFIGKQLLNDDDHPQIYMVRKHHRVPDQIENFDFVGCAIMDLLNKFKRKYTQNKHIESILDKLLIKIISQCCCDYEFRDIHKQQSMNFLCALSAAPWVRQTHAYRFNKILEIMLTYNLNQSILLFVKSFEIHVDYPFLNQFDNNICKRYTAQYVQPQEYNCQLSAANTKLLIQKYKEVEDVDEHWFVVVVKLHFNGMIDWNIFYDLAEFKNKKNQSDLQAMQIIHKDHRHILKHMQRSNSEYFFPAYKMYSVAFFIQNGLNPFLFDFMRPKKGGDTDWIAQLLKFKMSIDGWPYNMYLCNAQMHKEPNTPHIQPYLLANYLSEISIDNFFTMNEGLDDLWDYRYRMFREPNFCTVLQTGQDSRKKIAGKYILEASTFLGITILALYQQQTTLKFKIVMDLVEKTQEISERPWLDILMFPHACVKSQLNNRQTTTTIVHCKLNILSLLELLCVDFQASDLEILLEKMPEITTELSLIKENIKFSLYFSDKLEIFKRYFRVVVAQCGSPHDMFNTHVLSMPTNHHFIAEKLHYFNLDMLTFVSQYGRNKHLQYFIQYMTKHCDVIQNLQERLLKQSTQTNLQLSNPHLYYIHRTKSPIEHLIYIAAIHGHQDCFDQLFQYKGNKLRKNNLKNIIKELVTVMKFDATNIELLQNLFARRRAIFQKILQHAEQREIDLIPTCRSYLKLSREVMTKPTHYIRSLTPGFLKNRHFMRSELEVIGEHFFQCITIIESECSIQISFTMSEVVNLTLLYSHRLLRFVLKRVLGVHKFHQSINFNDETKEIFTFLKKDDMHGPNMLTRKACGYVLLYYILTMESNNRYTSVEEIKSNKYLDLIFDMSLQIPQNDTENRIKVQKFVEHFFKDHPIATNIATWIQQYNTNKKRKLEDDNRSVTV